MDILLNLTLAGGAFLLLFLIFRPLEKVFPAKSQKFLRPEFFTDVFYFLGQYLLWGGLVTSALLYFESWGAWLLPAGFRHAVAAQPFWLQAVEVIILSDFLIYWGHRIQHNVDFLWHFHCIHHSAEHLDWVAAHREHPLDTIYTVGLVNLPAILMGFQVEAISLFIAFRGFWAIYIHSNVKLPLGPLRALIGAPELHHWHHAKARHFGNYANLSPLMDILFGTYRHIPYEPKEFGNAEPMPRSYLGQMWYPFTKIFSAISSKLRPDHGKRK